MDSGYLLTWPAGGICGEIWYPGQMVFK